MLRVHSPPARCVVQAKRLERSRSPHCQCGACAKATPGKVIETWQRGDPMVGWATAVWGRPFKSFEGGNEKAKSSRLRPWFGGKPSLANILSCCFMFHQSSLKQGSGLGFGVLEVDWFLSGCWHRAWLVGGWSAAFLGMQSRDACHLVDSSFSSRGCSFSAGGPFECSLASFEYETQERRKGMHSKKC